MPLSYGSMGGNCSDIGVPSFASPRMTGTRHRENESAIKTCRIHITGTSGANVATVGRASADRLALPHHDMDDYFRQPTTPTESGWGHVQECSRRAYLVH